MTKYFKHETAIVEDENPLEMAVKYGIFCHVISH